MNWLALLFAATAQAFAAGTPAPAEPGVNVPWIKVDTVGYAPEWKKVAVVALPVTSSAGGGVHFHVLNESKEVVWQPEAADLRPTGLDVSSGDRCTQVDFSGLTLPGRYVAVVEFPQETSGASCDNFPPDPRWLRSAPFEIKAQPYAQALVASQKMFYYQRTRTALKEPYTLWDADDDDYTRATASHADDNVGWLLDTYPKKVKRLKLQKGWHDAGNFDMYIPSTAPAVQTLLWAYELNPKAFGDANNIPESGNGIPDVLDECTWGLDWMLGLQTDDGSFRAREAVMTLGEVQPGPADHDHSTRWVSGIGSASTAKACAAFAQASRVFKPYDPQRSGDYGRAALRAWQWLQAHPERVTLKVEGSDQPLWDDGAEFKEEAGARAAAAAEIWASFGDAKALASLQGLWGHAQLTGEGLSGSWVNISRFAVYRMAVTERAPAVMRTEAGQRVLAAAAVWRERIERADGYRCALGPTEYWWGTPSNLMQRVQLMGMALRLNPQEGWLREAMRDQWHWVLGRNPNACSLISRIGQGPERIYHLEWGKKKLPPPGYLIDGPNGADAAFLAPGKPAKCLFWDNPGPLQASGLPAHALWHNEQSDLWDGGFIPRGTWNVGWWVVTEVDIQYNADLVWAAALMQD